MTDKEKIRAEIERRITMLRNGCKHGEANELLSILSFIDSLQDDTNPILAWVEENYKVLAAPVGKLTEAGRGYLVALGDIIRKFDSVPAQITTNANVESPDMECGKPDDLAKEIDAVSKRYPEVSFAKLSRIAKHFTEWQKKQDEQRKDIETIQRNNGRK